MKYRNIADLVCSTLPRDVSRAEFEALGKPEWWLDKPQLAVAYALRKCKRINWCAYLANNPDVAETGIDPILHYMQHGIYESRRLTSWSPYIEVAKPSTQRLSIVVTSDGDATAIAHTLDSIIHQDCEDIEIILVLESDAGGSLVMKNDATSNNGKIKIVSLKKRLGLHGCRKTGLESASGRYVMFMRAGDTLVANAAQTALAAIERGRDIVGFGSNVICAQEANQEAKALEKRINGNPPGIYSRRRLHEMAFEQGTFSWNVCGMLYETALARAAFAKLDDICLGEEADIYEFQALVCHARTLEQINNKIYNLLFTSGTDDREMLTTISTGAAVEHLKRFFSRNYCGNNVSGFLNQYFNEVISSLWKKSIDIQHALFQKICNNFGIIYTIQELLKRNYNSAKKIAPLFPPNKINMRRANKIGIFYNGSQAGDVWLAIRNICQLLATDGYEISLFLEKYIVEDWHEVMAVKLYYISEAKYVKGCGTERMIDWYNCIKASNIDKLIYINPNNADFMWDALLIRNLGKDVIPFLNIDINNEMISRRTYWNHECFMEILRVLGKIICINYSTEIYLKAQGIDSLCINYPVVEFKSKFADQQKSNSIIVADDICDPVNNVIQCLEILKEVAKRTPDVTMVFRGGFSNLESKKKFYDLASRLGVRARIKVLEVRDNLLRSFAHAKVMLSAAMLQSSYAAIMAAQGCGLPVVLYDCDIAIAEGNESIIRVRQDDRKAAAAAICRILADEDENRRLATIAVEQVRCFSGECFLEKMDALLKRGERMSELHPYSPVEYGRVIRYMTWYADKLPPKKEF